MNTQERYTAGSALTLIALAAYGILWLYSIVRWAALNDWWAPIWALLFTAVSLLIAARIRARAARYHNPTRN